MRPEQQPQLKVLLDECVDPRAAKYFSARFAVSHVKDEGWPGAKNGELVRRASESFDVLFTIDGNMRHQTSRRGLPLSVVVATGHFRSVKDYEGAVREFEMKSSEFESGRYFLLSGAGEPEDAPNE